jgi:hypothetical protein
MEFAFAIITLLIVTCIIMYIVIDYNQHFKYRINKINVISPIDNNMYLVNDNTNKIKIANSLAKLNLHLILLKNELHKIENKTQDTVDFLNKLDKIKINESNVEDYTTYVVNKQHIFMCLFDEKTHNVYDLNLLTYAFIHELSHIYTQHREGHGPEFQRNFKFLLSVAKTIKIYSDIDFEENNQLYCQVKIKSNM